MAMTMEKFCSSIKRKYGERLINRQEQWPPCHGEKLIRLELIKRKRGESYVDTERDKHRSVSRKLVKMKGHQYDQRKEEVERIPITYSDLFKPEPDSRKRIRRVLVEGDAGIGKTTLCTSVSEDWANEKLFCEFNLLLLIPLREKEVASASSLPELLGLLHSSSTLRTSVADTIEEEEGENVLIVADGWDELNETERHDQSFLYKLLFGKLYPFISVLLTSRSSASASLHKLSTVDRFVAVCGFNEQNIKEYIQLEYAGQKAKSDSLLEQLESNPLIESICSIPLNCAIICHLWRTLEEALPVTMTELYTKIIFNILLRNVRKSYPSVENFTSFDALPGDLSKSWWLLCEFAFLALTKNSIVFSRDELVHFFPQGLDLHKDILCFGLLQYSKPILDTGYGMSFHFLHLTFQEYLAALHFVKQPLKYRFQSSVATKSMFCRFSSGIYFEHLSATPNIEGKVFTNILSLLQDPYYDTRTDDMNLELCHCAFEADYKPLTEKVIQYMYPFIPIPQNAHDCAAVLYLLKNISNHDNLDIEFTDTCASSKLIAKLTNVLASKHGNFQVSQLCLNGGHLTDNDIFQLFYNAAIALQSVQSLKLNSNKVTATIFMASPLLIKQCFCNLCHLNLSHNPLGASGIQCLENAVITDSLFSLRMLIIQQTLTSDQDINGALLFTLCDALSIHCPHLTHFNASHNNLGTPGAQAIGSALHHINKQENGFTLVLSNTNLYDEGISTFVSHLNYSCHLDCLVVSCNGISDDGASSLMERISVSYQYNPYVFWKLDISENSFNVEKVLSLIKASSCNFGSLLLCKCWLAKYPMRNQSLDLASQINTVTNSIQFLHLDQNCFCEENINILVKIIISCHNLEVLSCRQCGITSEDFKCLLSQLSCFGNIYVQLHEWQLNDNEIDDSGAATLIRFLSLFPNIRSLRFDGNPVSAEIKERLFDAVVSYHHSIIMIIVIEV